MPDKPDGPRPRTGNHATSRHRPDRPCGIQEEVKEVNLYSIVKEQGQGNQRIGLLSINSVLFLPTPHIPSPFLPTRRGLGLSGFGAFLCLLVAVLTKKARVNIPADRQRSAITYFFGCQKVSLKTAISRARIDIFFDLH